MVINVSKHSRKCYENRLIKRARLKSKLITVFVDLSAARNKRDNNERSVFNCSCESDNK